MTVGLTYIAGTLVMLGQSLASAIAVRSAVYLARFVRYLGLWAAIAIGALLGGWAYTIMGLAAIWLVVAALTVLVFALTRRVKNRSR